MTESVGRIKYLIKRVSESPFEFLVKKLKVELNKKVFYLPSSPWLNKKLRESEWALKIANPASITPPISESELSYLFNRVSEYKKSGYPCLGYGRVDIFGNNAFNVDCIHNYSWDSAAKSFTIDFIQASVKCDVKIPWEKSRLQWLVEMALLYRHDKWQLREIYLHLKAWNEQNPFLRGVNWISSMEVAIRLINLAFVYLLTKDSDNDELKALLTSLIACHDVYLELFPEISDVAGNHYLATEVGRVVSAFLKEEKFSAAKYADLLDEQFPGMGVHLEYSTIYHRLCVDLAVIGYLFLSHNGDISPVRQRINELTNTLPLLSTTAGMLPIFGDSDSGQVLNFGQPSRSCRLYMPGASRTESEIIYYTVLSSVNRRANMPAIDPDGMSDGISELYPFIIIKNHQYKLIVRYGKAGLHGRAPHDHDDILSFWLFKDDKDLVVERGCAPYTSNPFEREKFLSAGSHNTIAKTDGHRMIYNDGSVFRTVKLGTCHFKEVNRFEVEFSYTDDNLQQNRNFIVEEKRVFVSDHWEADHDIEPLICNTYITSSANFLALDSVRFDTQSSTLIEEFGSSEGVPINCVKISLPKAGSLMLAIT